MKEISVFGWISIFAISAMLINSIGILVIYKNKEWANKAKDYLMCFASGMLIASPLLIAFPEAIHHSNYAGISALAGFVFMYFSSKLTKHSTHKKDLAFGITAVQGILIHSLMDGVIYTITFSINAVVGIITGIGLVVHEFAEGVITFSMLQKGGLSAKKSLWYALVVSGLTTPIGAFVAYPFINKVSDNVLGIALGFVAGVLVYISASHLLPETQEDGKKHSIISFVIGISIAVILMLVGH